MKIMFNTMGLGKGGAERVINILSNSFVKNGNDVMIVANYYSTIDYDFDKKILIKFLVSNNHFRRIKRISIRILFLLKKSINKFKPDIIISFLPEPSFRVLFLKKICKSIKKIPIIVSVRNDPNTEYNNKLYKYIMTKLYPYANQLVLQTPDAREYFMDIIKYNGVVIPNPISNSFIVKRYNGKRDKRIVAVGRLEPQKNYVNMIDAFEHVAKKHKDFILEIYGDGYLRKNIEEYIVKKRLDKRIILMGKVDNVKDAIYKAAVFVMSSDYEGMPNSLLEAACLGVPCVSTNCPCGGPKEILDNGKCGLLVPIKNSSELASGINRAIEDKDYSNTISKRANNNSNKYAINSIVEQWQMVISSVIGRSKK